MTIAAGRTRMPWTEICDALDTELGSGAHPGFRRLDPLVAPCV
jgi:hypothetical protein